MANSIRTPKQGVTAGSRRIAQAVDNEEWQKFRVSLKGKSTQTKLEMLERYWNAWCGGIGLCGGAHDCDFCIRVDNYIKALCRGGQLNGGESLRSAIDKNWKLDIKRN